MTRSSRVATGVLALTLSTVVAGDGREVPRPAQREFIEASIDAVTKNGVAEAVARKYGEARPDGRQALPIKHVVRCTTESACRDVAGWARQSGWKPTLRTEFGHGSVPHWVLDLREVLPLDAGRIRAAALSIHDGIERFDGTRYDTWMLDLDPRGLHHAE